ncbi:MAG: peptidase dimerization domain-containing protein [Chloroflexota bacterium]|nr:peptidase dimerization domain-containing protein [Chloroflexota bacterium]
MINEGAFDDVGAAMMIHPGTDNIIYPYVLAVDACFVEFHDRNAHAAGSPWKGRNALDALVLAYQAVALMRQQSQPTVRIHGKIHHGGERPNIIHDYTRAEYSVRAPDAPLLNEMKQRVVDCFAGAAQATGCEYSVSWKSAELDCYSNMANNGPLAEAYGGHWLDLGVRATDLAGDMKGSFGSTDMGNVSHVVPAIHPMYLIPHESGNHTAQFTAAAATEEGHMLTLKASQAMALTALDWLTDPDLRDRALADFDRYHGN